LPVPLGMTLGLNPSRVGIDNLWVFMQDLDRHAERELPNVQKDVAQLLQEISKELMDLGTERTSPAQIRIYLTRIATDFQDLVKAGVEGIYGSRDGFVEEVEVEEECHRLRAAVHMENGKFANYMRQHGQKRKMISAEHQENTDPELGQILVTKEELSTWIKRVRSPSFVVLEVHGRMGCGFEHGLLAQDAVAVDIASVDALDLGGC